MTQIKYDIMLKEKFQVEITHQHQEVTDKLRKTEQQLSDVQVENL